MQHRLLNVLGTLMIAFSQWLQIILITRLLGLYDVGVFTYFLVITGPMVLFSRFSLSILVPTQSTLNYSNQVFFYYRNVMNAIFLITGFLIALLTGLSIIEKMCLIIFIIFKFFETKEEFIYTENIDKGHIKFLAYSKIYKSIITAVLFIISIMLFRSLTAGVASLLLSQLIMYYLYDKKYTTISFNHHFNISKVQFKSIFFLGIGLTMVEVLSSLVTNIPRYMIEHFFTMIQLGIFGTMMYFSTLTTNIVIAINQGIVSKLVKHKRENIKVFKHHLIKLFMGLTVLIIIGEVILLGYGTEILAFIYSDVFLDYSKEIILLGILLCLEVYSKVLEMVMSILNKYKIQVILQSVTFILIIIISFIFIIPYGIFGALFAVVITQAVLLSGQIIVVIYHIR